MEVGIADKVWIWEDVLTIFDEQAPKPGRPKTYKKAPKEISN